MGQFPARLLVLSILCCAALTPASAQSEGSCPVSPTEDRLPDVIAPMTGAEPLWIVGVSGGEWVSTDMLVKSAWVFAGGHQSGPFRVRGRRLDGDEILRFQVGMDGERSEEGFIPDVSRRSVGPGGASRKVMDNYTFVLMYLIFPSPGCWELTASFGDAEHRIVVEQVGQGAR